MIFFHKPQAIFFLYQHKLLFYSNINIEKPFDFKCNQITYLDLGDH